jgi:hypothetical protein
MPNLIDALVDNIIARVAERGSSISRARAVNTASAAVYLSKHDIRVPVTAEEASTLVAEALRQCRTLCAGWKEWADAAAKERCESIIEILMAAERQATVLTTRCAQEPICGWSSGQGHGVYTKLQWRQAA